MSLTPKMLSFAVLMGLAANAVAANPAVERAAGFVHANAAALRTSADDRFSARDVIVDGDRAEHVRFDRSYRGLPVLGGDFVVHSRDGHFLSASQTLRAPLDLDVRPVLRAADAVVVAGAEFGARFVGAPEASLLVYARGAQPALAWRVRLHDDDNDDMTYIVDARGGALLDRWSNNETAAASGTGKTLYSGNVALTTNSVAGGFELRDPSRGKNYTINGHTGRTSGQIFKDSDNAWGNNTASDAASAAADAQFGVAMTWDYYKNTHGRLGIANNGKGAYSRVHYGNAFNNAFWSDGCFCMTYGDGDASADIGPLVSLDITGHEMSHGVTARTAALVYSGESGGLNEATSDIFGTMVEFYANNSFDTPDYLIGEEIVLDNVSGSADQSALRYMFNPFLDGGSPNCWSGSIGSLDVHYSSGVANHFFYLLAEGSGARTYSGVNHTSPVCSGGALAGIGRSKAEKIWYRALTVYMTSNTNYAGARVATINAAKDLYGNASAEASAVAATWTAVSVP
ncbi:MAG: M4 family metallopeptidase [Arenimonas sp.]